MKKRIILVTGGSGGIGQAICRLAARRGYAVALTYRGKKSAADTVVRDIIARGGRAAGFKSDLGKRKNVEVLFARIEAKLGPVFALVTCAGDIPSNAQALDISDRRLRRKWRSNFAASFFCLQEAARQMIREGRGGAIVNVSSHSARTGGANYHVDYAAMKAGIDSITVGFARELAQHGIRVNAISPGTINTPRTLELIGNNRKKTEERIPLHRLGEPDEVAEAVMWLLSSKSAYVTGTILSVAGGR